MDVNTSSSGVGSLKIKIQTHTGHYRETDGEKS